MLANFLEVEFFGELFLLLHFALHLYLLIVSSYLLICIFLLAKSLKLIDLFGKLNVVPNSNPLGIKVFVSGISIHLNVNATL